MIIFRTSKIKMKSISISYLREDVTFSPLRDAFPRCSLALASQSTASMKTSETSVALGSLSITSVTQDSMIFD